MEKALETVPSKFRLCGLNPEKAVEVGGGDPVFLPGYGAPFVAENSGGMRPATLKDYRDFCRLVHTSAHLDMNGYFMVSPHDVPEDRLHLEMMRANLTLTDRPFMCSPADTAGAMASLEMARMVFGEKLPHDPPMLCIISPLSPLQFTGEMARSLMAYAKAGVPVLVASAAISGASGPITLAGILTLQNAEILSGLVLTQLVNPGAPFVYGGASAVMDMRSGAMTIGAPETARITFGTAGMARQYNLPSRSGGGLTDALATDAQAGYESAMLLLSAALSGIDFVLHAAGILGAYIAMSFEKFIMDEDMCGQVKKLISPVTADEDAIDLETLVQTGPGGNFLTAEKTLEACRTAFFMSSIFNKCDHASWSANGSPSVNQNARAELSRRLSIYEAPDLDPAILRSLENFARRGL